jgi:hypothetical protein
MAIGTEACRQSQNDDVMPSMGVVSSTSYPEYESAVPNSYMSGICIRSPRSSTFW